jgi:hypothetical protein
VQGARALQPSRTKGPCGLTGPLAGPPRRPQRRTAASTHAGAAQEAARTGLSLPGIPISSGPFDGRWLWRGGSTRSHPELGSENPLRGWYCRGHPVGEYGAAGLILQTPASILTDRSGRLAFPWVSTTSAGIPTATTGLTRRRGGRGERLPSATSASPRETLFCNSGFRIAIVCRRSVRIGSTRRPEQSRRVTPSADGSSVW